MTDLKKMEDEYKELMETAIELEGEINNDEQGLVFSEMIFEAEELLEVIIEKRNKLSK